MQPNQTSWITIILTTLGIFAGVAIVGLAGSLLYDALGLPFAILWGVLVLFAALGFTGVLGSVWARIRGTK